jgi:sugar-specific transcriptional regulator TrmB
MTHLAYKEKIDGVYYHTSDVFAEKEATSYEDNVNSFLDLVNEIRKQLSEIIKDYNEALNALAEELARTQKPKELIMIRENISPLYEISKKIIRSFSSEKEYKIALKTVLEDFKECTEDLGEIKQDIQKKLSKNKEIDDVLAEISSLTA